MKPPLHLTAVWGDPAQSSTIAVRIRTWKHILQGDPAVSLRSRLDDQHRTPVLWHLQGHRVTISDLHGGLRYSASLTQVLITDAGCDDPLILPVAQRPVSWPPPEVPVLAPGRAPWEIDPSHRPEGRLPPRYHPDLHAIWRNRRPRASVVIGTPAASGNSVPSAATPVRLPPRPEPRAGTVDARLIPVLQEWWNAHPGSERLVVHEAFLRARRFAQQGRPWYNRRDAEGRPIGIWHAVEELTCWVNLFNGGAAWLEWTWLIYGPHGIITPIRRSWSSAVRAECGILRASGHRSVPVPPAWHPALLVADAPVFDQCTPDPDQPGMVVRA